MEDLTNGILVILPVVLIVVYLAALLVLIKIAIYIYHLPKKLQELETRIKQLEDKEK